MNEGIRAGNCPIVLSADTSALDAGLEKAGRQMKAFGDNAIALAEREACAALVETLHEGIAELIEPRHLADAIRHRGELGEVTEDDIQRARTKTAIRRYMNDAKFHTVVKALAGIWRTARRAMHMGPADLEQAFLILKEQDDDARACGCPAGVPHVESCPLVRMAIMRDGECFQDAKGNFQEPPEFVPTPETERAAAAHLAAVLGVCGSDFEKLTPEWSSAREMANAERAAAPVRHEEMIDPLIEEMDARAHGCNCDTAALVTTGCQCGAMQRERADSPQIVEKPKDSP